MNDSWLLMGITTSNLWFSSYGTVSLTAHPPWQPSPLSRHGRASCGPVSSGWTAPWAVWWVSPMWPAAAPPPFPTRWQTATSAGTTQYWHRCVCVHWDKVVTELLNEWFTNNQKTSFYTRGQKLGFLNLMILLLLYYLLFANCFVHYGKI